MPVRVLIPTPLRAYAGRQEAVEVNGATVQEVLADLTSKFGELRRHLYGDDGRLRSFVNVYVNDEDIRFLGGTGYNFSDGDEVLLIPSIAGGSR